ncbi:MAG: GH25 family lysozyme [Blautia sp.]
MAKKGIDISKWQGNVDFSKVAKNVDFVILREGYRKTIDSKFLEYVSGCKKNSIPIHGVYHFCYATSVAGAKEEAVSCLANMQKAGLGKDVIVFFDFEYDTVKKASESGVKLGKNECIQFTEAFCQYVESQGYKAGVYCNLDYYKNMYNPDTIKKYVFWLADYTGGPDVECAYQQYTSSGTVPGISGNVDMDYFYGVKEEVQNMSKVEKATQQMEAWAKDDTHGYDQTYRWGEKGDFDCSAAVFQALENAGIPAKTYSFSKYGCAYTGTMVAVLTHFGFKNVIGSVNLSTGAGLKRNDILLNDKHHVAMYCGNGKEVEASINEKGTATGGQPGDQTGKEFLIRSYRNYPWTHVFRLEESGTSGTSEKKTVSEVAKEVIAGKWGNGDDRKTALTNAGYNYSEVQAEVNKLLSGQSSVPKKTVEEIAKEVIAGKWGNGDARKTALTKAGYDASAVQKKVNELLSGTSGKKSITEIAKEVIAGKWGNGETRKKKLTAAGYDASAVQKKVNELLK